MAEGLPIISRAAAYAKFLALSESWAVFMEERIVVITGFAQKPAVHCLARATDDQLADIAREFDYIADAMPHKEPGVGEWLIEHGVALKLLSTRNYACIACNDSFDFIVQWNGTARGTHAKIVRMFPHVPKIHYNVPRSERTLLRIACVSMAERDERMTAYKLKYDGSRPPANDPMEIIMEWLEK